MSRASCVAMADWEIDEFNTSKNILIDLLIVIMQPLDAVVNHKTVQNQLGKEQLRSLT